MENDSQSPVLSGAGGRPIDYLVHSRCGSMVQPATSLRPSDSGYVCNKCGAIDKEEAEPRSHFMARQSTGDKSWENPAQSQRDSELAYVCRCGAQFTRGGGDGSQGENEYLSHIGFFNPRRKMWRILLNVYIPHTGCPKMEDLVRGGNRPALAWYGRHRAQIVNMEANAHPDLEVRRLTTIIESMQAASTGFQQATDTLNKIVAYLRVSMPEELTGQPLDRIVVRLLQRLAKQEAAK